MNEKLCSKEMGDNCNGGGVKDASKRRFV